MLDRWSMLVIGLLAGLLLAWLLDYLIFRNRRICTDYEKELEASVGKLRGENSALSADVNALNAKVGRVGELERTLASRESEYNGLLASFDARGSELDKVNADLLASRNELSSLRGQAGTATDLEAQLQTRDTAIADLKAQFEARGAEISGLNARLADKDVEIGKLTGQLEEVDGELGKLGLGAAGAVAAGGLFAGLRGRLDSLRGRLEGDADATATVDAGLQADFEARGLELEQLRVDLAARETELGSLKADLGDVDLDDLKGELDLNSAEIARLNAELMAKDGELSELKLQVEGADIDGLKAEIDSLKVELDERDVKLRNLQTDLEPTLLPTDDVEIMRAQLEQRDIELSELQSTLAARDMELGQLQTELDDGDGKWGALGLASIGAAGAGGGLVSKLQGLRGDVSAKNDALAERDAEIERLRAQIAGLEVRKAPDDLTKIYGIGPKIAAILNAGGINTFEELADASIEDIDALLDAHGANFKLATPEIRASWHDQAECAESEDWEQFDEIAAGLKRTDGGSLNKIWGVGAKVEGLLADKGITTYQELANSDTADILDAIKAAQGYYPNFSETQIHQAWVEQARMAADQKWAQLKGYKTRFRRRRRRDDFTVIWGIGPKTNAVLHKNGINTYEELADATPETVTDILQKAGQRFDLSTDSLHHSWTHSARLAAIGDWDQLKEFQDKLTWKNVQDDD